MAARPAAAVVQSHGYAEEWRRLRRSRLLLVSGFAGFVGAFVGAFHLTFHGSRTEKTRKGAGVALVLVGALGAWMWWLTPKQDSAEI